MCLSGSMARINVSSITKLVCARESRKYLEKVVCRSDENGRSVSLGFSCFGMRLLGGKGSDMVTALFACSKCKNMQGSLLQ